VKVNLRTGALASRPPDIQYENTPSKPTLTPANSLEESLWRIEQSLASGQLQATEAVMTGVRLMRKQVAREEELLLQEYELGL